MPSLASLPPGIVMEIAKRLTRISDLASLRATCRVLSTITTPFLHSLAAERDTPLLAWASELGFLNLVRSLLNAGVDPNQPVEAKHRHLTASRAHTDVKPKDLLHKTYPQWSRFCQDDSNTELWIQKNSILPISNAMSYAAHHFARPWYPLHCACARGQVEVIELLLERGAFLDAPSMGLCACEQQYKRKQNNRYSVLTDNFSKRSPLHIALCCRQEDAARVLVDHGANLSFCYDEASAHSHALHTAAKSGCLPFIRFLLDYGYVANLNVRDSCGLTPLYYALEGNYSSKAVPFLLENGADVNVSFGKDGCTLLHAACYATKYDEAIKIITAGASVNSIWLPKAPMAFHTLCHDGLMPSVRPIEVCLMQWQKLIWGAERSQSLGDLERCCQHILGVIKKLIRQGANLNVCPGSRVSLASIAASLQSAQFLELLREAGVSFKEAEDTIQAAIWRKNSNPKLHVPGYNPIGVVEWLLQHGAQISNNNDLFDAILMGASPLVNGVSRARVTALLDCLLRNGMDPNLSGATGTSLFKHFFQQSDIPYCKKLFEYGASPGPVEELFLYILSMFQAHSRPGDRHIGGKTYFSDMLQDEDLVRKWQEDGASENALRFLLEIDGRRELIEQPAVDQAISVDARQLVNILLDARDAQMCSYVGYPAAL